MIDEHGNKPGVIKYITNEMLDRWEDDLKKRET